MVGGVGLTLNAMGSQQKDFKPEIIIIQLAVSTVCKLHTYTPSGTIVFSQYVTIQYIPL